MHVDLLLSPDISEECECVHILKIDLNMQISFATSLFGSPSPLPPLPPLLLPPFLLPPLHPPLPYLKQEYENEDLYQKEMPTVVS